MVAYKNIPPVALIGGAAIVAILLFVFINPAGLGQGGCILCNIPQTSIGYIISATDTSVNDQQVARMTLTPSGQGEYGIIALKDPLVKIGDYDIKNTVKIGVQTIDEKCSYSIQSDLATGRWQPKTAAALPIPMECSSSNGLTCNAKLQALSLIGQSWSVSQPTDFGIPFAGNVCEKDFIGACENSGGRVLTSTVGVVPTPWGTLGGHAGLVCYKVGDDVNKKVSYYNPTTLSRYYTGAVLIDSNTIGESVVVSNFNGQLTASSPDGNVKATLINAAFLPLIGKDCSPVGTFTIYKTAIGDVYRVPATYSPTAQLDGCSKGSTVSGCTGAVTTWNTGELTALIAHSETITSSADKVTLPTSSTGTYDDVRVASGTSTGQVAFYPLISVEAKGSFLGISRPEPVPHLTVSPTAVTVMSATDKQVVTATITNTGSAGAVQMDMNCPNVNVLPQVGSNNIDLGTTPLTKNYDVSSTAAQGTYTCKMTVSAGGANPSSATFTVNVKQECALKPYGHCSVNTACTKYVPTITCTYGMIGTCDGISDPVCAGKPPVPCPPSPATWAHATWSSDSCRYFCDAGYVENADKTCSAGSCPNQPPSCPTGYEFYVKSDGCKDCREIQQNMTCQQKVDAIQCGTLDVVACPMNKAIGSLNCTINDFFDKLNQFVGNAALLGALCCGGAFVLFMIGGGSLAMFSGMGKGRGRVGGRRR
jgi:hypothetical protein